MGGTLAHWGGGLLRHQKQQTDRWRTNNDNRQQLPISLTLKGKCVINGTVPCAGCVQDFEVKLHDTVKMGHTTPSTLAYCY